MLALCLMLLVTYHALNYAGIIGLGLLMKFNPIKCVILTVTNKTCSIHSQYPLYGQTLQHVSEAKYLGLTLDANLNFNKHAHCNCKKANATLGFIRRNTHYCQRYVKVDAYNTCVRPILDYTAFNLYGLHIPPTALTSWNLCKEELLAM